MRTSHVTGHLSVQRSTSCPQRKDVHNCTCLDEKCCRRTSGHGFFFRVLICATRSWENLRADSELIVGRHKKRELIYNWSMKIQRRGAQNLTQNLKLSTAYA